MLKDLRGGSVQRERGLLGCYREMVFIEQICVT